jgi:anhydro-N-acetylmuramic acid kinase
MARSDVAALGLMSGTSMDGVDVAFIETDGLASARPGPWATFPYQPALRDRLARVVRDPDGAGAAALIELDAAVTEAHAAAVEGFLSRHRAALRPIEVVGFHGHTILHRPERGFSRQIGDGARLAMRLGIDVVSDFRSTDVAAGGQGAPLAPLYHAALSHGIERPLAVLNVGGVANLTYIDADTVLAFDTGPGNALIDDWAARHTDKLYDEDGRLAASGEVAHPRLEQLLAHPYFERPPPKSLDRQDFGLGPVEGLSPGDGAATLTLFTVEAVARGAAFLPERPKLWLVTGGGRHNRMIMALLRARLGAVVEPVESVGWQGDALEAQAFGFLAVRALKRLPLTLPETTGVPVPTTGGTLHRAPRR